MRKIVLTLAQAYERGLKMVDVYVDRFTGSNGESLHFIHANEKLACEIVKEGGGYTLFHPQFEVALDEHHLTTYEPEEYDLPEEIAQCYKLEEWYPLECRLKAGAKCPFPFEEMDYETWAGEY